MSGDPYFLHRYRRAEGSGPWLHPPRPARRHRSIGLRYILLAAIASAVAVLLLQPVATASAATVQEPAYSLPVGSELEWVPGLGFRPLTPDIYVGAKPSCNMGFQGWYSDGDMCFPEDPCQDVPEIAVFDATPIVYGPETGQGDMIWGNPGHLHEWGDGYQTPYGYFWYTRTITEQHNHHGTSNEVSPVPLMETLGLLLSALLMSAAFLYVQFPKPTTLSKPT
jgi:hypothetical protein